MPKKPSDTTEAPAADAAVQVPEAAGELHFIPSLGISFRAVSAASAAAFAARLAADQSAPPTPTDV